MISLGVTPLPIVHSFDFIALMRLMYHPTEMQQRLKEFAKLYDVIKNERNKIVNLIQTSTQISAEMREKIKILANEMEILRTAVSQKER